MNDAMARTRQFKGMSNPLKTYLLGVLNGSKSAEGISKSFMAACIKEVESSKEGLNVKVGCHDRHLPPFVEALNEAIGGLGFVVDTIIPEGVNKTVFIKGGEVSGVDGNAIARAILENAKDRGELDNQPNVNCR